jgi:glutamate N-acetyltransferase/amino-acid N-acetyltransferase
MIAPNMATMLCFITTDAQIEAPLLQDALSQVVKRTFNRVTVDTDTSTNDMCLILANGKSNCKITNTNASFDDFCESMEHVCRFLAKEIARDGEGATKLIEVTVSNALAEEDAVKIAKTVAESPLVKTAIFGSDPNWGRILAAAGRSGVDFDVDSTDIFIEDVLVCYHGTSIPFDEQKAHELLKRKEVRITINLNKGDQQAVVYTCDYSYDYIKINAEYHT